MHVLLFEYEYYGTTYLLNLGLRSFGPFGGCQIVSRCDIEAIQKRG